MKKTVNQIDTELSAKTPTFRQTLKKWIKTLLLLGLMGGIIYGSYYFYQERVDSEIEAFNHTTIRDQLQSLTIEVKKIKGENLSLFTVYNELKEKSLCSGVASSDKSLSTESLENLKKQVQKNLNLIFTFNRLQKNIEQGYDYKENLYTLLELVSGNTEILPDVQNLLTYYRKGIRPFYEFEKCLGEIDKDSIDNADTLKDKILSFLKVLVKINKSNDKSLENKLKDLLRSHKLGQARDFAQKHALGSDKWLAGLEDHIQIKNSLEKIEYFIHSNIQNMNIG